MQSRVSCKLREVISEVTGNSRSDYVKSLREEHREGLLLGRKAYAIDNVSSGITLFMPWKLHGPIEALYKAIAARGEMDVSSFQRLVHDASLFPKSQSVRKKADILEYIIGKVLAGKGTLDFEEFMHALFLIAKYKASVLRVTEQCAFNHLLSTLINYGNQRVTQERSDMEVETPVMENEEILNQSMASFSLSRKPVEPSLSSLSSPSSPSGPATMGSRPKLPTIALGSRRSSTISSRSRISSISNNMKPMCCEEDMTSRAEQLFKMTEDKVTETCELMKNEIATLREQLEKTKEQDGLTKNYMDEIEKLKKSVANLMKELDLERAAVQNYKSQLQENTMQADESRKVMQQVIEDLEAQLADVKAKQRASDELKVRCQQIQSMLALQPDYETLLYSVFLSYRNEELLNGEFVMSELNCIAFCIDFNLDQIHMTGIDSEQRVAKLAFQDVVRFAPEGQLTYSLFKEFLLRLAELLDPQSTQKRAFQLLLMNNIFHHMEQHRNHFHGRQQHLINTDEYGQLPFDRFPMPPGCGLRITSNPDADVVPEGYMDVEGRMWIEQGPEDAQGQQQGAGGTPRFPE